MRLTLLSSVPVCLVVLLGSGAPAQAGVLGTGLLGLGLALSWRRRVS